MNASVGFETGIIPLGLLSLSAYVKKFGGYSNISLLDSHCQDIYNSYVDSDIVGITSVTQDIGRAVKFAHFVKSRQPNIPIILGGVHVSTYKELPEPFDIGVIGEGEQTLLELMTLNEYSTASLSSINGICYKNNGELIFTPERELIMPLDNIPLPDRELANLSHYLQPRRIIPYHTGRSLTLMTSRGCPCNCVFCSTKVHWKKFRAFSAERVIEEIEILINRYDSEIIHIFDDLFIADKKRLLKVRDYIVGKGFNKRVKFMCLIRSDMVDDEIMLVLKEMNVVVTGVGMESGCDKTLRYLKKNTTTVQRNRDLIELSTRYKIPTMGSFLLGSPNETEEDLIESLEFIKSYRNTPYFTPLSYIATTFPGTEFWDYAITNNIPVDNFGSIVMDIPRDISLLRKAPLLTQIPVDRFFILCQQFLLETEFKQTISYTFQ